MGYYWYEDPLHDQDIYNYVKLKQQLSIPILATEYPIAGLESYQPWIMLQATDFLRGDVAVKGGITTLVKTAHLAEAFRMNYEVHHGGNSLNNVANLHVIASIRNTTFFEVLLPDGGAEIRAGAGHRRRPRRHGACAQRPGPRRRHRLQADRTQEGRRAVVTAIYVDADACPVKAEIYRVAERYKLKVFVVSNSYLNVPRDPRHELVVVSDSFDAADNWIAERVGPDDIVVTADIPLADRSIKAGASVIGNTGVPFTPASIGMAMANRELLSNLRAMGEITGGPKPMAQRDRSRFLSALDEAIQKIRRRGGTR